MSYYRAPMGDYKTYGYAGDPGWLSSIWKGIKKIAPTIIGGIIGGLAVAIHTVTSDNQEEPLNWAVVVAAPIVGGLIGAGVGWLMR